MVMTAMMTTASFLLRCILSIITKALFPIGVREFTIITLITTTTFPSFLVVTTTTTTASVLVQINIGLMMIVLVVMTIITLFPSSPFVLLISLATAPLFVLTPLASSLIFLYPLHSMTRLTW